MQDKQNNLENNKKQIFADVIREKHYIVRNFLKNLFGVYGPLDWPEKIRRVFITALNAGGTGHVKQKSESLKRLNDFINSMQSPTYNELMHAFGVKNCQELFEKIQKEFKQIGPKKAALFIRDLFVQEVEIIIDFPPEEIKNLKVPVDTVITRTVNSLFNRDYTPNSRKTFEDINELAASIFPDNPLYLEDLWFWGRFYRCKERKRKKDIPYCHFNKDLLIVDADISRKGRENLLKYAEENPDCPFKGICDNFSHEDA